MTFTNAGEFLKRITVWILVVAVLAALISLFTTLSPLGDQLREIEDDRHYYTNVNDNGPYYDYEEAAAEVNGKIAAAWLTAGISAFAAFVGCLVLYVLGDIADNVWIIANNRPSHSAKTSASEVKAPAKESSAKKRTYEPGKPAPAPARETKCEQPKETNPNVTQVAETWICKNCGTKNKSCYGQCKKCGANRTK